MVFAYAHPDDPYYVIWQKLEEVFVPTQTAQMRFLQFQTREQLAGETVDDFHRSVVRLGREAYQPDGRQAPLLRQFFDRDAGQCRGGRIRKKNLHRGPSRLPPHQVRSHQPHSFHAYRARPRPRDLSTTQTPDTAAIAKRPARTPTIAVTTIKVSPWTYWLVSSHMSASTHRWCYRAPLGVSNHPCS